MSGFILLIALAAAIALMAAASCGDNDGKNGTAQEAATATSASESGTPALLPNTPAPASETVPGEIKTASRKLLADELDVDEEDFRLGSAEGMGWSDTSLGCPQEGYAYAQVLTSGYKLVFEFAGTSYPVHTNSDGSDMVICGDAQ